MLNTCLTGNHLGDVLASLQSRWLSSLEVYFVSAFPIAPSSLLLISRCSLPELKKKKIQLLPQASEVDRGDE